MTQLKHVYKSVQVLGHMRKIQPVHVCSNVQITHLARIIQGNAYKTARNGVHLLKIQQPSVYTHALRIHLQTIIQCAVLQIVLLVHSLTIQLGDV